MMPGYIFINFILLLFTFLVSTLIIISKGLLLFKQPVDLLLHRVCACKRNAVILNYCVCLRLQYTYSLPKSIRNAHVTQLFQSQ